MKILNCIIILLFITISYCHADEYAILDFTMENCPACKKMEIDTWQQKDVKNYLKESNIEIYYKTLEKDKDFCDGWSVDSYPTNILIVYSDKDKTWKRLETLVGYFDKDNFLTTIKRAIKNDKRRIGFKMLSKNR